MMTYLAQWQIKFQILTSNVELKNNVERKRLRVRLKLEKCAQHVNMTKKQNAEKINGTMSFAKKTSTATATAPRGAPNLHNY